MQLEDLRQNWLIPTEWGEPINSVQLQTLLANRPGLVDKMRRSARWEAAFTSLLVLIAPVLLFTVDTVLHRVYVVGMLVLGLGLLYFYYRMLGMMNRMLLVEGNVRGHLKRLAAGLRAMLRFYYRLTLASGPTMLILNFCFFLGKELARPGAFRWKLLGIIGGVLLVLGALVQVLVVYGTRWYLQRLYGQHLDRLEANLAELDEPTN